MPPAPACWSPIGGSRSPTEDRLALDIPFDGLRRIQFDIERSRPATLVIVPEHPTNEPQVLAVPPERFDEVTRALALIGSRLYQLTEAPRRAIR